MALTLDIELPLGYQLNPADADPAATNLVDELVVTNATLGLPTMNARENVDKKAEEARTLSVWSRQLWAVMSLANVST